MFQKWADPGLFLFIFRYFLIPIRMTNIQFELYKSSLDGVLGTQTRGTGWKAQMNPLSYGGTPRNELSYQFNGLGVQFFICHLVLSLSSLSSLSSLINSVIFQPSFFSFELYLLT